MKLHVHVGVVEHSLPYLYEMINNYASLAKHKDLLRVNIYCSDPESRNELDLTKIEHKVDIKDIHNFFQNKPGGYHGSLQHGLLLDHCVKNFSNDSHNIIADCDTLIVKQHWDDDVREVMMNHDIFGIEYPSELDYATRLHWYRGFPNVTWITFKNGFKFNGLSLQSDKTTTLKVYSKRLARIYDLPLDWQLHKEVGWELPGFVRDINTNLKSLSMPFIRVNSPESVVFKDKSVDYFFSEHHLNKKPFVVHMGRSVKIRFINEIAQDFNAYTQTYLKKTTKK